jgi:hypothetical protein
MNKKLLVLSVLLSGSLTLTAQQRGNRDESLVPAYTLPEVLKMQNGKAITTVKQWENERRPELLALFAEHVYGKSRPDGKKLPYKITSVNKNALGGTATRKEVTLYLSEDRSKTLNILIYLPNNAGKKPVPMFMGLNFAGNQAIHPDTDITINKNWTRFENQPGFVNGIAGEGSRGFYASRWAVELIISRGYGLATMYYGDLQADRKDIDSLPESFHAWYYKDKKIKAGDNPWGAIGIWAWGLSRALDYLEEDPDVDAKRVAVVGHSRLGKSALWAAAQDQRFAMAISNNSGEGGAAITRRKFGETIKIINTSFPHWFGARFKEYADKENDLPVDFHEMMALIAPRPLYVASASEDLWADPKGEYLSAYHAGPVFQLYGLKAFTNPQPPAIEQPIQAGIIGYHIRKGKHDITKYDWERYVDFADQQLKAVK